VRDLWRWKDIGAFADEYTASVARHGVMLVPDVARKRVDGSAGRRPTRLTDRALPPERIHIVEQPPWRARRGRILPGECFPGQR